jgi:hypothetical protein
MGFVYRGFILERTDPGVFFEDLAKMRRGAIAALKSYIPY